MAMPMLQQRSSGKALTARVAAAAHEQRNARRTTITRNEQRDELEMSRRGTTHKMKTMQKLDELTKSGSGNIDAPSKRRRGRM